MGAAVESTLASFNPLPLPKQGEMMASLGAAGSILVFQSAPLTEARGDAYPLGLASSPLCFNPLPLPKQGEISAWFTLELPWRVSIRSPYRSKGRSCQTIATRRCSLFQSAPLTEARGDCASLRALASAALFQSAPLTEARGDVPQTAAGTFNPNVSIRSPYRSKGRFRRGGLDPARARSFNPLPLPKQGEIPSWRPRSSASSKFQSAPLTEARGDFEGDADCDGIVLVSIRSPYRSKGRYRVHHQQLAGHSVSIRSPYRSKGRYSKARVVGSDSVVSIRSPYRSKGRFEYVAINDAHTQFQSAPLTEARGDRCFL